jgi:hypothetical protein
MHRAISRLWAKRKRACELTGTECWRRFPHAGGLSELGEVALTDRG